MLHSTICQLDDVYCCVPSRFVWGRGKQTNKQTNTQRAAPPTPTALLLPRAAARRSLQPPPPHAMHSGRPVGGDGDGVRSENRAPPLVVVLDARQNAALQTNTRCGFNWKIRTEQRRGKQKSNPPVAWRALWCIVIVDGGIMNGAGAAPPDRQVAPPRLVIS